MLTISSPNDGYKRITEVVFNTHIGPFITSRESMPKNQKQKDSFNKFKEHYDHFRSNFEKVVAKFTRDCFPGGSPNTGGEANGEEPESASSDGNDISKATRESESPGE